ncbi:YgiT-type zinc finger protein [bacterium]|nr:YgiT-type zinc finger protein [bacterium]MBU4510854.1 YgiT-type zinc finger protein [bacterium]
MILNGGSVDLKFGVVVVKKVLAKVCSQCGEEWIDSKTGKGKGDRQLFCYKK